MDAIREKAIKFEAEKYGVATNPFVDGFIDGYKQGRADAIKKFAERLEDNDYLFETEYRYGERIINFRTAKSIIDEYEKEQLKGE